jgi:hypothetical protein
MDIRGTARKDRAHAARRQHTRMYPTNTQQKRERLRSSAAVLKARGAARIAASPMLLASPAPKHNAIIVHKFEAGVSSAQIAGTLKLPTEPRHSCPPPHIPARLAMRPVPHKVAGSMRSKGESFVIAPKSPNLQAPMRVPDTNAARLRNGNTSTECRMCCAQVHRQRTGLQAQHDADTHVGRYPQHEKHMTAHGSTEGRV